MTTTYFTSTTNYKSARTGTLSAAAALYGSIVPAMWSFQLALRSRGLGAR